MRSRPGAALLLLLAGAPLPLAAQLYVPQPTSIPPGEVSTELYRHLDQLLATAFPADVQAVVRESSFDEVSIQPIYDRRVDAYVKDRVLVVGDAGAVSRPHTGSGANSAATPHARQSEPSSARSDVSRGDQPGPPNAAASGIITLV